MPTVWVEVSGVDEALVRLANAHPTLIGAAQFAFNDGGVIILNELATTTPVRTGYLRSRNRVTHAGALSQGTFTMTLDNDAPYAGFIELGTRTSPARHFLWNAAEHGRAWIEARLRNIFS